MRSSLIEKTFGWTLRSNPSELWPVLSNTSRLNEALELPRYSISETFDGENIRRRYAEMIEDGVRSRWEEPSFEWVEGCWWRWRRFYDDGPLKETGGILMLAPREGGGTDVTYTLSMGPRGTLGRILVASGHLKIAAQAFEKISKKADSHRGNHRGDFFSNLAASRSKPVKKKLKSAQSKSTEDQKILDQISAWLSVAPLADRVDLRSKRLARCLGIDDDEALRACFLGVTAGALEIRYRTHCPECRSSVNDYSSLSELPNLIACRGCGAGYQRNFVENVEVLFRSTELSDNTYFYCAAVRPIYLIYWYNRMSVA